jgi:Bacterial Ig-like domain (group 3)
MSRNLRKSVSLLRSRTRMVGLSVTLSAVAAAFGLLAAPAASGADPPPADTPPVLADSTNPPPAQVGDTITLTPGTYSTNPTVAVLDTWYDCGTAAPSTPVNCTEIQASGLTYVVKSADRGSYIVVFESGSAATLVSPVSSNSIPVQQPPPPPAVTPPSAGSDKPGVSGTPQVGGTVKGIPVSMTGNPTYAYQWQRCASTCTAIDGATAKTYAPSAADLGHSLVFVETGTNAGGSTSTRSPQSAIVTAPTETTLQFAPQNIVAGQPVTLIATVTSATSAAPPTGTVTFANSGTPVRGCSAVATQPSGASATVTCQTRFASTPSGLSAVFTPAAGSLVTGSDSTTGGFVVGRGPTTTKMKIPRHLTIGRRVTFVAKVYPAPGTSGITPTGTVVFTDEGKAIPGCVETLSGRTARCSITYRALGTHAIAADYLGDATFSGSSSRVHQTKVVVAKPSGFVSALMAWTFNFSPTSTQVATLRVTGLVPGVSVALDCAGDGCPLRHHVYRTTKRACGHRRTCKPLDLAKRLHHDRLGVGASLTVRLTHRGWLGKYYRFVIRAGHKPKIVTACLAVGVTRPNIGCSPR